MGVGLDAKAGANEKEITWYKQAGNNIMGGAASPWDVVYVRAKGEWAPCPPFPRTCQALT